MIKPIYNAELLRKLNKVLVNSGTFWVGTYLTTLKPLVAIQKLFVVTYIKQIQF